MNHTHEKVSCTRCGCQNLSAFEFTDTVAYNCTKCYFMFFEDRKECKCDDNSECKKNNECTCEGKLPFPICECRN